jgi:hypothetical protein
MLVWKESQEDRPGKTTNRTSNADRPLDAVEGCHPDSDAADEDNHNLTTHHETVNAQKPVVFKHAFKDIEVIVQSAVVELVENLHPDKGIKDDGVELELLLGVMKDTPKNLFSSEIERQCHSQLIDCLANNHFPHGHRE